MCPYCHPLTSPLHTTNSKMQQTDSNQKGGEGANGGKKGKGHQETCTKDLWTKTTEGEDSVWEVGVDGVGESRRGKMGTTVVEQQ